LPTEAFLVEAPNAATRVSLETKTRTSEQRSFDEFSTSSVKNEMNNVLEASSPVRTLPSQTKPTKKNKKKHLIGGLYGEHSTDLNASKAQEKAQRKALRMFQKMSKNQAEGDGSSGGGSNSMLILKKSMKNLNRGMLSSLPDKSTERAQLEKLIKKQTKQRQKQLKSQKQQQRQLQTLTKSSGAEGFAAFGLNQTIPLVPIGSMTSVIQPVAVSVSAPLVGVANNYTFGSPSLVPATLIEKNITATCNTGTRDPIAHRSVLSGGTKCSNKGIFGDQDTD